MESKLKLLNDNAPWAEDEFPEPPKEDEQPEPEPAV